MLLGKRIALDGLRFRDGVHDLSIGSLFFSSRGSGLELAMRAALGAKQGMVWLTGEDVGRFYMGSLNLYPAFEADHLVRLTVKSPLLGNQSSQKRGSLYLAQSSDGSYDLRTPVKSPDDFQQFGGLIVQGPKVGSVDDQYLRTQEIGVLEISFIDGLVD